jgi:hypothetical protein
MAMTMDVACAMSVLARPADANHVRAITAHLKRTAQFPFRETILVIDTMRPERSAELIAVAQQMQRVGEIDRFVHLGPDLERAYADRHFSQMPRRSMDNRGIPLFGWIAGIESASTDYLFHADCDILIHSKPGFSWVAEAIASLQDESVMFVAPHPGAPNQGSIFQKEDKYVIDPDGNYRFKSFSSRRYVMNRDRFKNLLPLAPMHESKKREILMRFGGPSSLLPWECHVDAALRRSPYFRIHLADERAWGLHSTYHGEVWRSNLANIIAEVEAGHFPPGQAGHYDLRLADWLKFLAHRQ